MERLTHGGRRHAGRVAPAAVAGVVLILVLAPAGALQASDGPGRAKDEAATYTYLRAASAYERQVDGKLAQSAAAMRALASRIAGECPGAVAGAPSTNPLIPSPAPTPGERAARVRELEQSRWLTDELTTALLAAWLRPDRKAAEALARSLAPVRWSSHALTHQARLDAAGLRELTSGGVLDVCSDMRAWAQSGYLTLAAPTEALREQSKTASAAGGITARVELARKAPPTPYEGPRVQALAARVQALRARETRSLTSALTASEPALRKTLGFGAAEEAEAAASDSRLGAARPAR
ncbi:MAG TPA: hypothetical protein VMF09_14950 [Solirubrobacteraceae bacterium]|nr:hypothetical protein [Solirubrobacteraceae bacterium]